MRLPRKQALRWGLAGGRLGRGVLGSSPEAGVEHRAEASLCDAGLGTLAQLRAALTWSGPPEVAGESQTSVS